MKCIQLNLINLMTNKHHMKVEKYQNYLRQLITNDV